MTVFLLLFRGVGGATQLPVRPLREALTAVGFDRVATYINSGNAVVASDLPRAEVQRKVAELCADRFGFRKDVHACTREEWAELIAANPFREFTEGKALHAAVLGGVPDPVRIEALCGYAAPGEGIAVVGSVAYLHTPLGFGASKLGERFDTGIGVPNTARNWNTVRRLMELADEAAT